MRLLRRLTRAALAAGRVTPELGERAAKSCRRSRTFRPAAPVPHHRARRHAADDLERVPLDSRRAPLIPAKAGIQLISRVAGSPLSRGRAEGKHCFDLTETGF
jgi:hypothetical protein